MSKDASYYKNKIITIPNILSLFRLSLIPVIIWMYCVEENYSETALLVIVSGISDLLDGFIARKFNMISDLGKFIDPFADKMTQMALLVCLSVRYPYMLYAFILLFIKEFVSTLSAFIAAKKTGIVNGAQWHGKLSTVLLYGMIFLHIVWIDIPSTLSYILVGMCVVLMLYSFFVYESEHLKRIIHANKEVK